MRVKQYKHQPIIFGNCKEVLATVIMFYFAANIVFGAEENETEFCRRGWSEFVNDRKKWESECLNEDSVRAYRVVRRQLAILNSDMKTG